MDQTNEDINQEDFKNRLAVEQGVHADLQQFVQHLFGERSVETPVAATDVVVEKGASLSLILERLTTFIEPTNPERKYPDVYNLVAVQTLAIRGYLSLLAESNITKVSDRIHADTVNWLSQLFKFENCNGCCHEDRLEGLLKVAKLALYLKYTKYASDGFTALYTRPPVIYVSAAAPPSLGKDLKTHLGLPQSSICTVPCNSMFGSPYTMDVAAFERLLTDDVSCGKTPLLLIGYCGTPLAGHTDNLGRLREICTQCGVWFHVEGDTLTTLALPQVPLSVSAATNADSATLDLNTWFGVCSLPYCTLFRTSNLEMALSAGLLSPQPMHKLRSLPIWLTFQFMGMEDLQKVISHGSEIAQQLADRIDIIKGLKRIEQLSTASLAVVFKYKATPELRSDSEDDDETVRDDTEEKSSKAEVSPAMVVSIPSQLTDELNRLILKEDSRDLALEAVTITREGLCIKFNPLPTCREKGITKDHINQFCEKLQQIVTRLDVSLIAKNGFSNAISNVSSVVEVDTGTTPCIGAFQCIPKYWKSTNLSNLSDSKKREINSLNAEVVEKLSVTYPVLQLCKNASGQNYILVGLISTPFDINSFVESLSSCLNEVEDNSMFLESISEAVQKSILEAEERLHRESEEKFFEEGLLRHVPVVGSLYNWFSPPPKDNLGVTGRSFQISKGKLETTEKTYKLKMQVSDSERDSVEEKSSLMDTSNSSLDDDKPQEDNTNFNDNEVVVENEEGNESGENNESGESNESGDSGDNIGHDVEEIETDESTPTKSDEEEIQQHLEETNNVKESDV